MTKYVIYRRLSKEDRSKNQHGFDSQMNDINIFLEQQDSPEVIGDFKEFVSGAADVKPELEKAMKLCEETGSVLLVAKLDRLSRRVLQIATYLEGNINFKIACMPQADNFQITIYAALAQQEREFIQDRIKRGLRAAKQKGVLLGSSAPTYKKRKALGLHKQAVSREHTAATEHNTKVAAKVEEIISINNELTSQEVCNILTRQKVFTRRGNEYSPQTLGKIMKDFGIKKKRMSRHETQK